MWGNGNTWHLINSKKRFERGNTFLKSLNARTANIVLSNFNIFRNSVSVINKITRENTKSSTVIDVSVTTTVVWTAVSKSMKSFLSFAY